jgi:hypothetical protein
VLWERGVSHRCCGMGRWCCSGVGSGHGIRNRDGHKVSDFVDSVGVKGTGFHYFPLQGFLQACLGQCILECLGSDLCGWPGPGLGRGSHESREQRGFLCLAGASP